jgi:ABC-type antimicrobial peptide transport system permease subunit
VFWQTTTVALAGIVIGVPVGIVAGRLIWQAFAGNLGVVAVPVVSVRTFAVAALGTLILANVLAAGPALAAARARPASLLRTE